MASGKSEDISTATRSSTTTYVLPVICLAIGIAVGYLLRGSSPPPQPQAAVAQQQASGTPPITAMGQPTPEQLKHMADKQAEPLLQQLKTNPNDAELLANIGNVYYDAQQFKEAVDYYQRSAKVRPGNANVLTDMGTAYYRMGNIDKALARYEEALRFDSKHANALFNIGMVKWQGKGDAQGAVVAWERMLQTNPDLPRRAEVEQLIARAKQHAGMKPGETPVRP